MRAMTRAAVLPAVVLLTLTACTPDEEETTPEPGATAPVPTTTTEPAEPTGAPAATAALTTADGTDVGTVTLTDVDAGTEVMVDAEGLEPGFYGFHVHGIGLCEPESADPQDPASVGAFLSAGGHLGADGSDHGSHAGDLPSLHVTSAGSAHLTTITDAFTAEDLLDDDGSAVMIHAGRDNFAHIPERYAPEGPDQETLATGDAGDRLACGVVQ